MTIIHGALCPTTEKQANFHRTLTKIFRLLPQYRRYFSSTLCGALVKGFDMGKAVRIAVDFTVDCIKHTLGSERALVRG